MEAGIGLALINFIDLSQEEKRMILEGRNKINIKSVRPFYGLHPKYLKDILGKKAKKDYKFADRLENNTI